MYYSLDALGQLPIPRYTQLCLIYSLDAPSYVCIEKTLKNGLHRLSIAFPWIAGEVVFDGASENHLKTKKIKFTNSIPLIIKDLRNEEHSIPTMNELRQTKFPVCSLDESDIAPCRSIILPSATVDSKAHVEPVFMIQANLITGGLLLTVAGHHSAMDITGLGEVIRLLSKACHEEPFTSEELVSGNLDRQNIIPVFDESYKPAAELGHHIRTSNETNNNDKSKWLLSSQCNWRCFVFDEKSLHDLKLLACDAVSDSISYVSTDDSLTALIYQSVIRSRLSRLNPTANVTCSRIVNVRKFLDIPPGYPGFVISPVYHTYTVAELAEKALGDVALQLRSALDPSDLAYRTREVATCISRIEDTSAISLGPRVNSVEGLVLSSWAKVNCRDLDFNLHLGKPEAIRIPLSMTFEGVAHILPKSANGEVAVAICLRDEDMEHLKMDEELSKYAVYVG
ncbi:trichothecene 3-O-acetyltransferase [Schizosaccharomyces japonicus yFS275]|uniref:Trichothecene 3-O-acetyltransferase n=1 Tax=Schizosaccharomyces japonicus (strain yFS275 / FY16936) TaxID=402676 RepID=B6K1L5_SCHJY|nr:trichothecene 3-O-acetyltransferase [Schizosaccharomyces japonicus yFS275]EEB07046.1 trichothecene 3-O-acetyltransferase [Schizosaccharomyces japonicus yFS275]